MDVLTLHGVYFIHTPGMSATHKVGAQVGTNNLAHQPLTYNPFAEAQYIGIVVLPGAPSAEGVITYGSPDPRHFVGCNGHANARAAN